PSFIWQQMQLEPERYRNWYFGLVTNVVRNPLLRAFQAATIGGVIYLAIVAMRAPWEHRRRAWFMLVLALGTALVFAGFINNKAHVYMPNLLLGFAVCAGAFTSWIATTIARTLSPRFPRVTAPGIVVALVVAHTVAGIAYYEKWYSITKRSELRP